jgi:anti-sigma factor RsiW
MQALRCKELVELVTDYLEDGLSRRERKRFEAHLAVCGGCTAYIAQMRETIRLTGSVGDLRIPEPIRLDLLEAFRGWNTSRA